MLITPISNTPFPKLPYRDDCIHLGSKPQLLKFIQDTLNWEQLFIKELQQLEEAYAYDGSPECASADCLRLIRDILGGDYAPWKGSP